MAENRTNAAKAMKGKLEKELKQLEKEVIEEEEEVKDNESISSNEKLARISEGNIPTKKQLGLIEAAVHMYDTYEYGKNGVDLEEYIWNQGKPKVQRNRFERKEVVHNALIMLGRIEADEENIKPPAKRKRKE